jgi:hypothetical protein
MEIELAGDETVADSTMLLLYTGEEVGAEGASGLLGRGTGHRPLLVVDLDQLASGVDAGELFEEKAALAAAAEAELASEVLVSGAAVGRALYAADQIAVGVRVCPCFGISGSGYTIQRGGPPEKRLSRWA